MGYYKKATGKASVTWEETVDEALCFGWIDGIRRSYTEESYVVRFTPRKPKSVWSRRNIERVEALKAAGRMERPGLKAYATKDVHADSGYAVADRPEALPDEMRAEFKKHAEAWAFYASQPPGYRKQTTAWVTSAKREETRQRRLATLIDDSANGLRIKPLRRK
ncbi:MAG: YdeI/OmpD-associated family protein [Acidobacteriota bacterium]